MSTSLFAQLETALRDTYRLERELGGGGMSRVYLATDVALGRKVVLKVLPPDISAALSDERFRREIHVTANLQHPHIVPVFAAGSVAEMLYYTMPFVAGQSLRSRIDRGGALSIGEVESITRDVLQALAYAHRNGVVHRDIKPDNILLSDDGALVTDFGIAKAALTAAGPTELMAARKPDENLTGTGISIGTVRYMAPEQLLADPTADHRVDLYALGLVIHECLTGRLPFAERPTPRWREAVITETVPSVTVMRAETPVMLAGLVERCLDRDPDKRPRSAEEALKLLGTRDAAAERPRRRGRRLAIAGGVTAAVLALGGWAVTGPLRVPLATARRIASRPDAALRANRVIVAPFEATPDEPQLRALGAMLADYVAQGLAVLPNVEVVDPRAALVNAEVVDRIPRMLRAGDRGVALAKEVGARVVITGRVFRDRDSLRANAAVIDAGTGRIRQALGDFTVREGATRELVDRIRRRAAAAVMQASDSSLPIDFGMLSTPPSAEAYSIMRTGLKQLLAWDSAAVATLRRASAADRRWVMPRLLLVVAASNSSKYAMADSAIVQLRALTEHASPIERALLDVHEANFRVDRPAAHAAAEQVMHLSPGSAETQLLAASQALQASQPRRAIQITDQIDPDRGVNLGTPLYWRYRAVAFLRLGQHARALDAARAGERRFPTGDFGYLAVQALAALKRTTEVEDAIESYAEKGARRGGDAQSERQAWLTEIAALQYLRAGDPARAQTLVRRAMLDAELVERAADTSRSAMTRRLNLAALVGDMGVIDLALRQLAARRSTEPHGDVWVRGMLAARRGDAPEMARADAALERVTNKYDFGWAQYQRARIATLAGDREQAVRLLTEARAKGFPFNDVEGFRPDLDPLLLSLHGFAPFEQLIARP